jgi:hypothetical protein
MTPVGDFSLCLSFFPVFWAQLFRVSIKTAKNRSKNFFILIFLSLNKNKHNRFIQKIRPAAWITLYEKVIKK